MGESIDIQREIYSSQYRGYLQMLENEKVISWNILSIFIQKGM